MTAPAIQGTPTGGGRVGPGSFTVPVPSAAGFIIAVGVTGGGTVTPAAGWTLIGSLNRPSSTDRVHVYSAAAGAGTSWSVSDVSATTPLAWTCTGFDSTVSVTMLASSASATSPSITTDATCYNLRGVFDAPDNPGTVTYPTGATLGRSTRATAHPTDGYSVTVALAYANDATVGASGTAAWSIAGAFEPLAFTAQVAAVVLPDAPSGLMVTGADHALDIGFGAVTGADSYVVEWRRSDLTPPPLVTQTSAPSHLDRIDDTTGTDGTYTYTWDGTGVRVYMIDRGIRPTHNDFTGRVEAGLTVGADPWDTDTTNHGTGTSSMAVGTTYGVAKGAHVVMISPGTPPDTPIYLAELTEIVDFILADHASSGTPGVVNCSLFLLGIDSPDDPDADAAIAQYQRLIDAGLTITFAIGNDGTDRSAVVYKAPNGMLLVGCSTTADAKRDTSDYSTNMAVFAPSASTVFASNASNSATQSGGATSEAAPMVAGVIAKILHANPDLSPDRVREVVTSQASPILTSVPVGPPLQLNGNANTHEWSRHPTGLTSLTLDGLDTGATYEIRVRTIDGGVASDWSTTVSGATKPAHPTVKGRVGGSTVVFTGMSARVAGTTIPITAAAVRQGGVTIPIL